MYSTVRLAALSLAKLGPPYSQARILVSVGDCVSYDQLMRETTWSEGLPIEWRVAPHYACESNPITSSGNDRYSENPRADVVVLCDADLCVVARFDELLNRLSTANPLVAGLQAHFPPFPDRRPEANNAMWHLLLDGIGMPRRPLGYGYSLVADRDQGSAPAYFNYGFVAFNRPGFLRIAPLVTKYTEIARGFLTERPGQIPGFQSQIGLTLAIAAAGLDVLPLGHAYNCANDDLVFAHGLGDIAQAKVLHYLRGDEFDRNSFVADPAAHATFIAKPLQCRVSERLRQHVLTLADPLLPALAS